ncbi:MAG: dTDP-4-dehydrorhamnose 3,5-epimerase [Acidobacteriia bacterium]|nr:dTDP-4-dehydrorhamnose 3,5-epimerase [Terriglobia bacterium]
MLFTETKLKGAFVLEPERREDNRGFFARTFCQHEFEAHGLNPLVVQCNIAYNKKKGTLRGMHFQNAPFQEAKLVRCTRGAIQDVILDLRPDSPTYKQWVSAELNEDNHRMLYVPEGFAHGYQTLTETAEVIYQVSQFYAPESASGVRHNDPAFGIRWPLEVTSISELDKKWPDFKDSKTT